MRFEKKLLFGLISWFNKLTLLFCNEKRSYFHHFSWPIIGTFSLIYTVGCLDLLPVHFTHTHTFNGPLSRTTRVGRYQKGKTNLDFTEARDSEWQWHQLGHMQVCTSLQADNDASTPPLSFYRPDALPAAQPTVSKHWRHASGTLLRHQYLPDCPASQKIRSRAIVNKCTGKAVTVTSYPCSANVALADRQKWSCRFRDTIFCILISCGLIVNSRAAKNLVINEL